MGVVLLSLMLSWVLSKLTLKFFFFFFDFSDFAEFSASGLSVGDFRFFGATDGREASGVVDLRLLDDRSLRLRVGVSGG